MTDKNPITDQIRAMVQWAYSEHAGVDGSIFELFSGQKVKNPSLKPDKRSEGFSPTRIHATESRRPGQSRIPIYSGHSGGEVKRAVASLHKLEQNWIHHCYNPSSERKSRAGSVLIRDLWREYQLRLNGTHARTRLISSLMLRVQLHQSRSYPGLMRWSASRPRQFSGVISRSSWSDTYSERWEEIHAMIERLDITALMSIYRKIYKEK